MNLYGRPSAGRCTQGKHHTMEMACAGWRSTGVLCLLLACSACSHQRSVVGRDDLVLPPIRMRLPETPETAVREFRTDSAVCMASYPRDVPVEGVASDWVGGCRETTVCREPGFGGNCQAAWCKVWADHQNYYSWDIARDLTLAVAAAAVLANTSLDEGFQDWYQDDVRGSGTSRFANDCKVLGEAMPFVPAFLGLAVVGSLCDEGSLGSVAGEFGSRTTRGYLVGGPPVVVVQRVLGGSRPGEHEGGSRWEPLGDANTVSGHAFMGAVPWITAAKMTDRAWLKAGLYACSTLPAWSRMDDDSHYLSQVCLGWWMAYLASSAVDRTENEYEHLTLVPVTTPEMVGIGAVYER